jgi:hypothetical protein
MSSTEAADVGTDERDRFYAAALAGLRALDRRERAPRRFGPDADTRWAAFKGSLTESDRVDILLRDAAVTWGAAFSPAEVFGLFGLAPDEAFGPDWHPLGKAVARRLLVDPAAVSASATPRALATLLAVEPGPPVAVPPLSASTRLAVAGGAALIAVAEAFAAKADLSWSDQVLAVATKPAHRQLAGLLAVVTGSAARTRLTRPGDDLRAVVKAAGFTQLDVAVVSADAEVACADFARRAAGVA